VYGLIMKLAEFKIHYEGSFITYETLHFYNGVLNIKMTKVVSIPRM
jgi:hypothetical protein